MHRYTEYAPGGISKDDTLQFCDYHEHKDEKEKAARSAA